MIKINLETEGILSISGPAAGILCEYTALTRLILARLIEDLGEEKAFIMLAACGRIAAEDTNNISNDILNIQKKIEEVFDNEIQI